jgi:K+-sensing histidine kinase KdpD
MARWLENKVARVVAAFVVPMLVCAAFVPVRRQLDNTHAALVLVLVVVAVATLGDRVAGVVAALSSGIWFDFLLTRPYERLAISSRDDIETAALLLLVGLGVTELSMWGHRQRDRASREEGYLRGITAASMTGRPIPPRCPT